MIKPMGFVVILAGIAPEWKQNILRSSKYGDVRSGSKLSIKFKSVSTSAIESNQGFEFQGKVQLHVICKLFTWIGSEPLEAPMIKTKTCPKQSVLKDPHSSKVILKRKETTIFNYFYSRQ